MRIRITISQRFPITVTLVLIALASLLTLMSVLTQVSHYLIGEHLPGFVFGAFYLDQERSFPTLYQATMLLLCSVLLAGITLARRAVGARYARHWGFLAALFLCLFADEILQIHEEIAEPLRNALGTSGFLYYAWVIPALILLVVIGVLYAKFVVALPGWIRRLFLISGLLYVTGAVGLEMVGGYFADSYGRGSVGFIVESNAEEFLEMLGIAVFIYASLEYVRLYVKELVIPPASM